eukprot:6914945-Prorocentrum_lima.AAC.1
MALAVAILARQGEGGHGCGGALRPPQEGTASGALRPLAGGCGPAVGGALRPPTGGSWWPDVVRHACIELESGMMTKVSRRS